MTHQQIAYKIKQMVTGIQDNSWEERLETYVSEILMNNYQQGYDAGVKESVKASLNLIPHHIDVHKMFKTLLSPTDLQKQKNLIKEMSACNICPDENNCQRPKQHLT